MQCVPWATGATGFSGERTAASVMSRVSYYRRVFSAYLMPSHSQLSFWHDTPAVNENAPLDSLGEYYMPFLQKADYPGPFDAEGIPLLDYRGRLGLQYNPIAIAQYGLGNYNSWKRGSEERRRTMFFKMADWLTAHLERNGHGLRVWHHHFDWEYRTPLKAPWYSALAQGQGISLLVRAHQETQDPAYLDAATHALESFLATTDQGGVTAVDAEGHTWFEEVIVKPPTHILNGFIWASWGAYDYYLHTGSPEAKELFNQAVDTLTSCLNQFDVGFWSLYEQSGTRMKMLASSFYHSLHIVQLQVMHTLTGEPVFAEYAERWEDYRQQRLKRTAALIYKAVFKLLYY